MTQWRKFLMAIIPALLMLFLVATPVGVSFAADDDGDTHAETTEEHASEESGEMMAGSAEGAGITLSLIALDGAEITTKLFQSKPLFMIPPWFPITNETLETSRMFIRNDVAWTSRLSL